MTMEDNNEKQSDKNIQVVAGPKGVIITQSLDTGRIVGVVTNSEPSSLALLAAGVAGRALRQARRQRTQ